MSVATLTQSKRLSRTAIFLLFFLLYSAVIAILPLSYRPGMARAFLPAHAAISAALMLAALLLFLRRSTREYGLALYALAAVGAAILVSTQWHMDFVRWLGYSNSTPQGLSVAIFFQSALRVAVALALMKLSGASWDSFYLRAGNLKLGLAVGMAGFLALAALAFVPLFPDAAARSRLISLLPWILLFVLSNGFAEELLFRGILLRRFEPFLGKGLSLLLTTLVFTIIHMQANYVPDLLIFAAQTFPLALAWGWLMQKSNSLWGSALFHAGADCYIIFGVYAAMT
jgi:membrane protease YdiL (CAAX protease family)